MMVMLVPLTPVTWGLSPLTSLAISTENTRHARHGTGQLGQGWTGSYCFRTSGERRAFRIRRDIRPKSFRAIRNFPR